VFVWYDLDGQAEMFARGEQVRRIHWGATYRRDCR
jgi:hypothetical protein